VIEKHGGKAMAKESWRMPSDVLAVHTEIEFWRKKRQKRGAIPSTIWFAASALAKRYGVYRISQALRLNYGALKQRLEKVSSEGEWSSNSNSGTDERCEFVELTGVGAMNVPSEEKVSEKTMGSGSAGVSGMEIEVSDRRGCRMTVRVMEDKGVDIPKLISTFWSQSR
jgi:hypothetical protein